MTDETREALRSLLHNVRHWTLGVDEALERIAEHCRGEVTPTTPPDTGTTLGGPPVAV